MEKFCRIEYSYRRNFLVSIKIDASDIKTARETIKPFVKKTTLKHSNFLSSLCQGTIYLKLENAQLSHSFKIRGAFNRILKLTLEEKQKGIITCSSGNHGLATAIAAKELDVVVKIVIPETTPQKKVNKIKK